MPVSYAIAVLLVLSACLAVRRGLVDERMLVRWLLAPICPLLGWGPLTHTYLNHRAREAFLATDPPAEHPVAKLLKTSAGALGYVQHSIDPDVIKTYSFMTKQLHYEYAHNPLPNRYAGRPVFGHALWQAARTEDERLLALGWMSHQIADQFAHNLPFDRFFGYVNREAYFGYYWDEVMHHLQMPYHEGLGGAFYTADHWVTELIIDAYVVAKLGDAYQPAYVLKQRAFPGEVLERVAPGYIAEHRAILDEDYVDAPAPIEAALLPRCMDFADLVNAGIYHYVHALLRDYGAQKYIEVVEADPKFAHLGTMLELVVSQLAGMLADPERLYAPARIAGASVRQRDRSPEEVVMSPLAQSEPGYWNEATYAAYKAHRPQKPALLQRILRVAPLGAMRWMFATFPLTSLRGPVARACLPRGYSNLSLAMLFAWRLREGEWSTFPEAMGDVLESKKLLSTEPRLRLRTF